MWPFIQAVLAGALTAAAPFVLLTTSLAVIGYRSSDHILDVILLALFPMTFTLPIVCAATLLTGLPLSFLLERNGRESAVAYVMGGTMLGGLLPVAFTCLIGDPEGWWLGLPGLAAGAVTGWTWWRRAREPVVLAARAAD